MTHQTTSNIESMARRAKEASWRLASLGTAARNRALEAVLDSLTACREAILAANRQDMEEAARLVERGDLSAALMKRLDLSGDKFTAVLDGLRDLIRLPDPVGQVDLATRLDEGLELYRVSCPIGVLGVIFEARPDAAVQISTLAIKSGNAVLLKGGREALRSNAALVEAIRAGLAKSEVPADAVQLLTTREEARAMLALDPWIDLIIPRGSNELVRSIQEHTSIPVLGHADGICHVYVDAAADPEKAARVVVDSKTQYPAVCNAAETLLIHKDRAPRLLPILAEQLQKAGVELRCDARARQLVPGSKPAAEEDWRAEYLDLIISIKVVDSLDEAIEHINRYGSHHTDAIVTEDGRAAEAFFARVDSAGVYQNASTRFADGYRYGFGAEVGVSTSKTHARGPVGLEGLVIYKYRLYGNGHRAGDYGPGKRGYQHQPIPREKWRI
ncbi:MAG: glutamate-5-semialdehyde dehydrogenase [Planctomycetes bacterium]|nr:glutamate-5-semialdehyde dehydrogenase [Planctomycetota bacterium]